MKKILAVATIAILTASALVWSSAPLPRPSPELSISVPGGSTTQLSSLRGQVVVLEFLFVKSAHCLRVARLLNQLHGEAQLRGFQPVGIAFDPPNNVSSNGELIAPMVDYFKLTYPIGYTTKATVDSYLGRNINETLNIPQIVVIDRAGMIRAVSGGRGGDPALEDADTLRALISRLLAEGA